ncbi:MAG: translocation/assembly module TamB domain-containing protein, partial [Bacteroidales bacterium]
MLAIILLPVLLVGVLRIGPVQDMIVQKATSWLSDELNAEVSIDKFRVTFTGSLVVSGFNIDDPKGEKVASFEEFSLKLNQYHRKKNTINLGHIKLSGSEIFFSRQDSMNTNIDFLIDYFESGKSPPETSLEVYCNHIAIQQMKLHYQDWSVDTMPVDYSFTDLTLEASGFFMNEDSTAVHLKNLSFKNSELFDLENLSVYAGLSDKHIGLDNINIRTPGSEVNMSLELSFDSLAALNTPYENHIGLSAVFQHTAIIPGEFSALFEPLKYFDDTVFISGNIGGELNNLLVEDFRLSAMPYVDFRGEGSVQGPADPDSALINVNINNLFVNTRQSEQLIKKIAGDSFSLPGQLLNLGNINVTGQFKGMADDFTADAVFATAAGDIVTDLEVVKYPVSEKYGYEGKVEARGFDLAVVMADEAFGYVGFSAIVNGVGLDKYADATLEASIDSLWIDKRRYNNIDIRGSYGELEFDGMVNMQTEVFKFMANGSADFSDSVPQYVASLTIPHADLKAMNLLDEDFEQHPIVSTSIMLHMSGENMDNLSGWIGVDNTRWKTQEHDISMQSLFLDMDGNGEGKHELIMESDYFEASLDGRFNFRDLPQDLQYVFRGELPSLMPPEKVKEQKPEKHRERPDSINFNLKLKNTDELSNVFFPGLQLAEGTFIKGSINVVKQEVSLEGASDYIKTAGMKIRDFSLKDPDNYSLGLYLYADRIQMNDTIGLDRVSFTAGAKQDSVDFGIRWDDYSELDINKGEITGFYAPGDSPRHKLHFYESDFIINDTLWQLSGNSVMEIDSLWIAADHFRLSTDHQSIVIDGALSADSAKQMTVLFDQLNISNIDPFTKSKKFDLDGYISGEVSVQHFYSDNPVFSSNLTIDSVGFNQEHLGNAVIQSGWVDSLQALFAKMEISYKGNVGVTYPLKMQGYFYPFNEEENFDFNLTLENYKLHTIEGYLESFSSYFRGLASGEMQFRGTLDDPQLLGELRLMRTVMKIDYLNTTYSMADTVRLTNNEIIFDEVSVNDNNSTATRGNQAVLDGKITHQNFKDIQVDLSIDAEKFTVLNTTYSPDQMYYGTAIATGKVKIKGPENDIFIDVRGKAERGSRLFIPLTNTAEASQTDYITFVQPQDTMESVAFEQEKSENVKGLQLNAHIEATPDAEIQIIFDETVGDIMKARGSGEIELNIDTRGEFGMYGTYRIQEGDYLFTLENIINKRFTVEQGGTISWSGDPMDAQLDLKAIYKTEARLYDLISYLDTSDIYKKRRPVHCVLHLDGDLMNPGITPDIVLPNADEMTRQLVHTTLYLNANEVNQQEMNRQFVGLLVLNSFFPPSSAGGDGAMAGSGNEYMGFGSSSSSELISNQLSNWLSQISDDFNIGVNYRAGDEISNEEVEVALSTQLFNDRMTVNTNVGVGGSQMEQQTVAEEDATNIVGDVNVEYELTDKLRVRAFNRHNNYSYLNERGPYTQGLGLFYRREFNSLKDLFKRNKKQDNSDKENQRQQQEQEQEEQEQEEQEQEEEEQEEEEQEEEEEEGDDDYDDDDDE